MDIELIRKYARAIARIGANPKKGQGVLLIASTDESEFANMVTEELYDAGASEVVVRWQNQKNDVIRYKNESEETLSHLHKFEEALWQEMAEKLPCRVFIMSEDPDGLKGAPMAKVQKATAVKTKLLKPYRDAIENKHQWVIAAVPSENWAKKVFPEEDGKDATEHLWKEILSCCRISKDKDPVKEWEEHNRTLKEKAAILNSLNLHHLHYESSEGTDFTCSLIPDALWLGAAETLPDGTEFVPNMPTEEVFTSPLKGHCEGTLVATMPLSYMGNLIENFSITFHEGKAVSCKAEKGEEILRDMINTDETSCMLGELAIVPVNSPIYESGTLFYNTLFDENAACHVALGMGFDNCIKDFSKYTHEEILNMGVNDSVIHTDFMVGSPELDITGYKKDGTEIAILRKGKWAI